MRFEWDDEKAKSNEQKHGVRFEVACRVFDDAWCIETPNTAEQSEMRWNALGLVDGFVLLVIFSEREEGMRISSARKADRNEREDYWNSRI